MSSSSPWTLTPQQVLQSPEVTVLVFHNVYPEGKQGGIEIIQHGERIATNGDLRLEPVPGQWAALPNIVGRGGEPGVSVHLAFQEAAIEYTVRVTPEGESIRVTVDLAQPLSAEKAAQAGFNLELLPSAFFGKSYMMSAEGAPDVYAAFPRQGNGPTTPGANGQFVPVPLARGTRLVAAPEDPYRRLEIQSFTGDLALLDGRDAAQNGWFVVRSQVVAGQTRAVEWLITPGRVPGWVRPPVLLVSQVGYHPDQEKQALIELDPRVTQPESAVLLRAASGGMEEVLRAQPEMLEPFLFYRYARFDFTAIREPGLYQVKYGETVTPLFKIGADVYQRDVWQPTLETFIPVQMCHVRVEDIYRIWHGACHLDDALQAPPNHEHFDGYHQYAETETSFAPFTHIPGLDRGGWHDAGDYDLATGSQAGSTLNLALIRETFSLDTDQTTVQRDQGLVILHAPDGVPDILQQVAHGVDFLLSAYRAVGHSIAGVIEGSLKQYVHLGDAATMTDNRIFDSDLPAGAFHAERSSVRDDRWAFTNQDTCLEYQEAAALAAAARVLKGHQDDLAAECLGTARGIWEREQSREPVLQPGAYIPRSPEGMQVLAAVELLLATGDPTYAARLEALLPVITERFDRLGWAAARALPHIESVSFHSALREAAARYRDRLAQEEAQSPFRLPFGEGWLRANRTDHDPFAPDYHPPIWGIGWSLQGFALQHFYLVQAYPDLFNRESVLRVLNYVLGWHPANSLSLVSGVGAQSLTIAYGTNRAEWSYIPGGVASGPALLRPNLVELMDPWPWLWQQKEYVIGGAVSYVFLVLAADRLLNPDHG